MADNDELESDEQNDQDENEQAIHYENQTDGHNVQQVQLNARKKAIMNKFKEFRSGYVKRWWPYLNPSEYMLVRRIKKINLKEYEAFEAIKRAKIEAFKAGSHFITGPLLAILPYVIIGLLVLVGIMVIISVLMPWLFGLFDGGTSGAPFGVNGADFYGMRYVYRDAEQSQADLWADYANALNYTIENFADDNLTLKLEMPLTADGEVDIAKLTETEEEGAYADEYALTKEIAKVVYLADTGAENADALELNEILAGIKYFGLDAEIVNEIASDLAQYIEDNAALYTPKGGGEISVDVSDTLQPKFEALLLDEYVISLAGNEGAPTRTDLIYIKDYILGEDEDSTVDGVPQENYLAMIYLPKNNVKIDTVTYTIFGVETADFNVAIYSNGSEVVGKTDSNFGVFQEKDEDAAFDSYVYEVGGFDLSALLLQDFEKDFLTTEKSLFNILRALKTENGGENAGLLDKYLAQADETNTAFWADAAEGKGGEDAGGSSGKESGAETKYYTFNYQPYLAVLMHNAANTPYSFTEFETNLA